MALTLMITGAVIAMIANVATLTGIDYDYPFAAHLGRCIGLALVSAGLITLVISLLN